jgi:hypothetical protein
MWPLVADHPVVVLKLGKPSEAKGVTLLVYSLTQPQKRRRMPMKETISQPITKMMVWNAYRNVKANKDGAGIDEETIEAFDANPGAVRALGRRFQPASCDLDEKSRMCERLKYGSVGGWG